MKTVKRSKATKDSKASKARQSGALAAPLPETPVDEVARDEPKRRVIERPDGFYWQSIGGNEQSGPFTSRAEAEDDLLSAGVEFDNGETLQEAESEVGISEWIDPDTGGPAEDSVPRIEDH
jgi:hypothetical protein